MKDHSRRNNNINFVGGDIALLLFIAPAAFNICFNFSVMLFLCLLILSIANKPPRTKKLSMEIDRSFKCGGFRRYGCSYEMKFVKPAENDDCAVFQSGDHYHAAPNPAMSGIPQHVKQHLLEGIEDSLKPAKVYRKLSRILPHSVYENIALKQVQQAMVYLKKSHCSVLEQNTIGYLNAWLEANELTADSDMHTVGVLHGWKCTGSSNIEHVEADVHFIVTTKRLLYNLVEQAQCGFGQFLSIDATYSLLDVGYPVQKLGTVDAAHKYHDAAICIARHENTDSFALTFDVVKAALRNFFQFEWQPQSSVPDKAKAIYNALTNIFPPAPDHSYPGVSIAICYFHNKQAIEKNKSKFSTVNRREAFEKDVEKLHAITSNVVFKNATELFESKWSRREKIATTWYMSEWGQTLFHAGATPVGAPVANCATETSNRAMKEYVTNHERLAMGNFLGLLIPELVFQSKEADKIPLSTLVRNNRERWGFAQLWVKRVKKFVRESTSAANKVFHVPSSTFLEENKTPSLQQLRDGIWQSRQHQVFKDDTFDTYVQRTSQFYALKTIESPKNTENYFSCTCPQYWKYGTCKHSLGMSILKGKVCVPPPYVVDSIEELKKRGRPPKVKNFMEKQK